ncbi:hypothetical protein ACFP1Z_01825 [Streptomyces gamaensis]|uniref:Uncharacterized protein n=1 Tax=Streptomyces gamaensis TaxID=1763542 RepID=A0ABW0YQT9_9ACTN
MGRRVRRGGLVGAAVLGLLAGAGCPARAAGAAGPDAYAYRAAPDARPVQGSRDPADGPLLRPGPGTYTDSLRPGERKFYTVELDAASSAYVSAVAAPRPGTAMGPQDGIEVALQKADGTQCGVGRHRTFLSAGGPYPVADYAERVAPGGGTGGPCALAGTYRFTVKRGEATGGDAGALPVELAYTAGEGGAPSAGATEGGGGAAGTGFGDAVELRPGTREDRLRPGQTRFYRVAAGTGQQLAVAARFGAAAGGDPGPFVINGVRLGLHNAARGYVMNRTAGYRGETVELSLTTPPVAPDGGDPGKGASDAERGMRLPGWYYLQVSLNPKASAGTADGLPVTLDVQVGAPRAADARRGMRATPRHQAAPAGDGRHATRRIVGYAGIGTGSALLLGLGAWTLAARRGPAEPTR